MLKKKHNTPYYVLFPLVPIILFSTLHSQRPQYTQTTTTTKNTPKKKKLFSSINGSIFIQKGNEKEDVMKKKLDLFASNILILGLSL
jgi:hypothetical protein